MSDGDSEETKLGRVCVGDRAEARLMGFEAPIVGRADTITCGITVSNATPGMRGRPSIAAVHARVRLAQRVPARIRIIEVPLVSRLPEPQPKPPTPLEQAEP